MAAGATRPRAARGSTGASANPSLAEAPAPRPHASGGRDRRPGARGSRPGRPRNDRRRPRDRAARDLRAGRRPRANVGRAPRRRRRRAGREQHAHDHHARNHGARDARRQDPEHGRRAARRALLGHRAHGHHLALLRGRGRPPTYRLRPRRAGGGGDGVLPDGLRAQVLAGAGRLSGLGPAHPAGSRISTSTGASSANASASARVPMFSPQCIGTATRGWIRLAASAASPAVMTYVPLTGSRATSTPLTLSISGITSVSPEW